MNVLILTPDAVGSTLLQRMLTIYMQFHEFDRPVINLHELTNGLAKYYSPEFNRELVGKRAVKNWGYYQQLNEIVDLLDSVDHYKTSRLAHYHILRRGDTIDQQIPFYNYLNENFYIIACRRSNVFEHALSLALTSITKKLNVYTADEKIDTFFDFYHNGVNVDTNVFVNKLNLYKYYLDWSAQHFEVSKVFNYEQDVPNLEKFILDLPVFSSQKNLITWDKNFGIDFNDFNRTHYALSDIGSLNFHNKENAKQVWLDNDDAVIIYQKDALPEWPAVNSLNELNNLPAEIQQKFQSTYYNNYVYNIKFLDLEKQNHVKSCYNGYQLAQKTIKQMVDLGIIISGPPIKKQTLTDKKKMINNFDQCVELYNQWVSDNPEVGAKITNGDLFSQISCENNFWNQFTQRLGGTSDQQPIQQLEHQSDDNP
jgi:hypothetical protein